MSAALQQISRRRTFAIISHPDAGKTTLTEKFLLYGGAVQLAGSVTSRKNQRATTSDWMELEKQRGISVSSTVLQFDYNGCVVNLLDTPGHKDFSEDTYRVLTAVDAAVMVIDAGKGIETQTRKLFEVCRQRGVPIFTFMNKLDRPARPPLELLDELESVLGIHALPMNWPLGDGVDFKGVYDRREKSVHLFERTPGGTYRAPVSVGGIQDEAVRSSLAPDVYSKVCDELDLLDGAGTDFDFAAVSAGKSTPVFFGSAMNNFGVQLLLDNFLKLAPSPTPRPSGTKVVQPDYEPFSGFVFKKQANMNPKHRDRAAYIRIVSGVFERDMNVIHTRTGKKIRLSNSQRLFAQDRETVDAAYPGDVVALVGNYDFHIGDTLAQEAQLHFHEIPRFAPECFSYVQCIGTEKFKRFREGLDQLLKEGLAQPFEIPASVQRVPLLGAVGPLQFEVLQYRLENEYGAPCRVEPSPWNCIRWVRAKDGSEIKEQPPVQVPSGGALARDVLGDWVVFLSDAWLLKLLESRNEDFEFLAQPLR
ncbi:MAG: peptide chain release factor 3 [Verrucomicrobiales bacterium]